MYDVDILNKQANLKELTETLFGVELKYRSHQWEGHCPLCNSQKHNHFYIPENQEKNKWYCRQCTPSGGKAIDLVKARYGLTERYQFREACDKLAELLNVPEGSADYSNRFSSVQNKKPVVMMQSFPDTPSEEWQTAVKELVLHARDYLWSNAGTKELDYLRNRGFTDKTIHDYCLGFNPNRYNLPIMHEGKPVKALSGFYIPTFMKSGDDQPSNILMRVKVRTEEHIYRTLMKDYQEGKRETEPQKYLFIAGSGCAVSLFCSQYARPNTGHDYPNIIFVEGEFDAITINQVAGDICRAVTFGSHGYVGKAETWQAWYRIPEHIVICFDNDSKPEIVDMVRKNELKLQQEIIKAQSLDVPEYRGSAPVIKHLPEQYHDWNDILKLPDGAQTIRSILSGFFRS